MTITPADVHAYQALHLKYIGRDIEEDVAYGLLQKLLTQMELVYKSVTVEQIKALNIEISKNESRAEGDL